MNKRGEISINAAAWRVMGDPWNVTLMYLPPENGHTCAAGSGAIAVKHPVAGDDHFFRVRKFGRGGKLRVVRARRLLKQFGIKIERTLVFDVSFEQYRSVPMLVLYFAHSRPLK
jgi:hypothetical protein